MCLRNNIDVLVDVLKPKWLEQFGNILLCVAAIVICWQFSDEQLLLAIIKILDELKKIKRERIMREITV